ncbi:MAG: hypothetical protein ACK4N5_12405, partial [Myxococcales bacterium]
MRRTWALLVQYRGDGFKGWQPQPDARTVAGELRQAFAEAGLPVLPWGAARTDAGVHARAQVASFTTDVAFDPPGLLARVDAALAPEVRVRALREAPPGFHAMGSAIGKVYRYALAFGPDAAAMRLPQPRFPVERLDPEPLARALQRLADAPDLSALCYGPPGVTRALTRA